MVRKYEEVEEQEAERLRKISKPIDQSIVEELSLERGDLEEVLKAPVRVVPVGAMEPFYGWHHWSLLDGKPKTVEIFIEDRPKDEQKFLLKHESCHSKVMAQTPNYPSLSEEEKEELVRKCEIGIGMRGRCSRVF